MYRPLDTRYDTMQYRRCGKSGLKLPAISLGLWHNFGGVDTLENARALIRRAFDLGITHLDLANNYSKTIFPRTATNLSFPPKPGIGCGPARMASGVRGST
jgi:hypothetical protein